MSDDPEPVFKTPRQQLLRDLLVCGGGLGLLGLLWLETGRPVLAATPGVAAAGVGGVALGVVLVAFGDRLPWPESRALRALAGVVVGLGVGVVRLVADVPEAVEFVGVAGLLVGASVARVLGYLR